jgi:hypothetical protein
MIEVSLMLVIFHKKFRMVTRNLIKMMLGLLPKRVCVDV